MANAKVQKTNTTLSKKTTKKLEPLKVKCTSTDCGNGLHCFLATKKMLKENLNGRCRACGISLIDWNRVHGNDPEDAAYTFASLRRELVRHHFWHVDIDIKASNHARRKGKRGMREAIEKRIRKYVAPSEPPFDGRQTPRTGNSIFYAQHATATCCRKCLEEWHGIKQGVELTTRQISYFSHLVMLFVEERLPYLREDGERIPPIKG